MMWEKSSSTVTTETPDLYFWLSANMTNLSSWWYGLIVEYSQVCSSDHFWLSADREKTCYTKIITYARNFLYHNMIHTSWQDSVTNQYRGTSWWTLSTKLNEYFQLQVQASVRKLADSIQTVKTVLGMKIQSEQKLVSILFCLLEGMTC